MSKVFDNIMKGLQEAVAHARGEDTGAVVHHVTPVNNSQQPDKAKPMSSESPVHDSKDRDAK